MKNVANDIFFDITTEKRNTCRSITNFFFQFPHYSNFRRFPGFQVSAKQSPMSRIPDMRNIVPQLTEKLALSVQNCDRNVDFSPVLKRKEKEEIGVGAGSPTSVKLTKNIGKSAQIIIL